MDGPLTPAAPPLAPVLAAGCVVWRRDEATAEPLVALVHRPKYDDWSLPKGKSDADEYPTTTAVRETFEETGARVALGRRLPSQVYPVTADGVRRSKVVDWWLAEVVDVRRRPPPGAATGEIDHVAWLPRHEAAAALTHERDRVLLASLDLGPIEATTVVLVRHASAGSRGKSQTADAERPLDALGVVQRARVTALATCFDVGHVASAEPLRCIDTVSGYAIDRGLKVAVDRAWGELANQEDVGPAMAALRSLVRSSSRALVCSQGGVIPHLVRLLHEESGFRPPATSCPKGSAWVLGFRDGALVAADFHPSLDPAALPLPSGAVVA